MNKLENILNDLSTEELKSLRGMITDKMNKIGECKLVFEKPTENYLYNRWGYMKKICWKKGMRICDEWVDNPDAFFKWCKSQGFTQYEFETKKVRHKIKIGTKVLGPSTCFIVYK